MGLIWLDRGKAGMAIILTGMACVVLQMLFCARRRVKEGKIDKRSMWVLLLISTCQLVLLLLFFLACKVINETILLFGTVALVLGLGIDEVILMALTRLEEKRLLEERLRKLYAQRQLELEYYEMRNAQAKETEQVRRRFLGQIEQAQRLLEEKKGFARVRETLDSADRMIKQMQALRFCENPLVNAVLAMKYAKAQEWGIEADFRVMLGREAKVDPMDLCSLFCNLLDNALEACMRIGDTAVRKEVRVRVGCRGGCLVLQVQNTNDAPLDQRDGHLRTLKKGEGHGLGLQLVERIVKRYQGSLSMECVDGFVTVDVVLNYAASRSA